MHNCLQLCVKQHISLHHVFEGGDDVLQEHLDKHAKNASMISSVIQNELISICGDQVRLGILQKVQKAKFFAIIIDEVADMSRKEQLSIVLRIVDSNRKYNM